MSGNELCLNNPSTTTKSDKRYKERIKCLLFSSNISDTKWQWMMNEQQKTIAIQVEAKERFKAFLFCCGAEISCLAYQQNIINMHIDIPATLLPSFHQTSLDEICHLTFYCNHHSARKIILVTIQKVHFNGHPRAAKP